MSHRFAFRSRESVRFPRSPPLRCPPPAGGVPPGLPSGAGGAGLRGDTVAPALRVPPLARDRGFRLDWRVSRPCRWRRLGFRSPFGAQGHPVAAAVGLSSSWIRGIRGWCLETSALCGCWGMPGRGSWAAGLDPRGAMDTGYDVSLQGMECVAGSMGDEEGISCVRSPGGTGSGIPWVGGTWAFLWADAPPPCCSSPSPIPVLRPHPSVISSGRRAW